MSGADIIMAACCCGFICEFDSAYDGPTKGSKNIDDDNLDYPIVAQAQWETLRDSVFALADNLGGDQVEPIGGLGRYGAMSSFPFDIDHVNVEITVMTNDDCEIHFNTSGLNQPGQVINSVSMILETDIITTAAIAEDFTEVFTFALRNNAGGIIRTGMVSSTPDAVGVRGIWNITIPVGLINTAGNTTFRFSYESVWAAPPTNYPIDTPDPDDNSQFWQGWINIPTAKLYISTNKPCP